jgi:uncharacterized protein (DUF1330 family)
MSAPAYLISEVRIRDAEAAERYKQLAAASIRHHGGRYLARGATPDCLEGAWDAETAYVLVEFPSVAQARSWYASPEYAEALALSEVAVERRLLLVEGLPPD